MAGGTRLPGPRAVLGSAVQAQAAGRSRIGAVAADCSRLAPTAPAHCRVRSRGGARARPHPLGWQPSRFLTDRAEAERAYALAERLGSVNAAASQLGTTWPSLRKAFTRHGLGMPTRNPEAVRQRAVAAARQRSGQPATPPLDPVFVALNPQALPARPRPPAELHQWVRREEEYATLVTHPFRILPKACFLRIAWVACANDVAAWTVAAAPSRQLTAKAPSQ